MIIPWAPEKRSYKAVFKKYRLSQFHNVAGICMAVSDGTMAAKNGEQT